MMNIVYISREYPPSKRLGGIGSHVKTDAESLAHRGHKVTVIAASDDTRLDSREIVNGVHLIRLSGGDFLIPSTEPHCSSWKKLRMIYRFHSYRKRLLEEVRKLGNVDILEVCEYGAEAYYLKEYKDRLVLRLATPTLLDRNTFGVKRLRLSQLHEYWVGRKELQLMTQFPHVTSCCKTLGNWCQKYVKGFTNDYKVIFNPIDLSKWLSERNTIYEENTVLFAGTVSEAKGVGDLIEACKILIEKSVPVKLTIAGKLGSYAMQLQTMCNEKGFSWCHFTGHISQEELKHLYAVNKVSCFPSWWEAFANVVMEAMAAGNVIVGSTNGGMTEIIDDGIEGLLVEPKRPALLAEKLKQALDLSPNEVQAFRSRAHQRLKSQVSTNVILNQMEDYYQEIVKENSKRQ